MTENEMKIIFCIIGCVVGFLVGKFVIWLVELKLDNHSSTGIGNGGRTTGSEEENAD